MSKYVYCIITSKKKTSGLQFFQSTVQIPRRCQSGDHFGSFDHLRHNLGLFYRPACRFTPHGNYSNVYVTLISRSTEKD